MIQRIEEARSVLDRLLALLQSAPLEGDRFVSHLYQSRREYRRTCEPAGRTGKQIERCVIATFRIAESLGFKGTLDSGKIYCGSGIDGCLSSARNKVVTTTCPSCLCFSSIASLSSSVCKRLMIPSPGQLRAFMLSPPGIEAETTGGSSEDYDDRTGYLADFLGASSDFRVALPLLKVTDDLVQVERAPKERPFELRYQNFSLIMSRSRRFCCITGVNIDGSAAFFRIKRPGWKLDPRVPKGAQVGGAEFYVPTTFDRGHMVRRLDPVWGTENIARLANADTHHYTNSCP